MGAQLDGEAYAEMVDSVGLRHELQGSLCFSWRSGLRFARAPSGSALQLVLQTVCSARTPPVLTDSAVRRRGPEQLEASRRGTHVVRCSQISYHDFVQGVVLVGLTQNQLLIALYG